MNLVLYGAYNLSNSKCIISTANGERSVNNDIQRVPNAQDNGSTIVNKRTDEKPIEITGTLRSTTALSLERIIEEFDRAINEENRAFKITRTWFNLADTTSDGDYLVAQDAVNKRLITNNFQRSDGSIGFDLDVSVSANDYGEIYITNSPTNDISGFSATANIEAWVYIPDKTYITGVVLIAGSDISNYLTSDELTTQYDGTVIKEGWNYFSVALSNMTVTGNPDYYSFGRYFKLRVKYQSAQADLNGLAFGGAIIQDDKDTRNYKGYFSVSPKAVESHNVTMTPFSGSFIGYEGLGTSTDLITVYSTAGATTIPVTIPLTFDGTSDPEPIIQLTLNSLTNVDKLGFTNLLNSDNIEVDEAWVAKDVIIIDKPNKTVTRNNVGINYSYVLPRFKLGLNSLYMYATATGQVVISYTVQDINLAGTI